MGDALDELVGLFDEDDGFGNSDDDQDELDQLFSKYTSEPSSNSSQPEVDDKKSKAKEQQGLTYRDLFGSPIKSTTSIPKSRKSDSTNENSDIEGVHLFGQRPTTSSTTPALKFGEFSTTASGASPFRANTLGASSNVQKNFQNLPSSASNVFLIDPNSKLRLVKHSISVYFDELTPIEKSLKDRNINVEYIPLGNSTAMVGNKNFWTTGVLVRKAGLRQSSKGNNYGIWEINDFRNLELNYTVFIFGLAATAPALEQISVGSVIDLVTPSLMDDAQINSTKKGKGLKFSVNNITQIRLIGRAHDFAYCDSRKKDGSPCKVPVNTSICPVCIHHASGELRKSLRKSNNTGKKEFNKSKPYNFNENQKLETEWKRRKTEGVMTTDFGLKPPAPKVAFNNPVAPGPSNSIYKSLKPEPAAPVVVKKPATTRMELQDSTASVKRSSIQFGNHSSIVFRQEATTTLEVPKCDLEAQKKQAERKALVLDPQKNRHLTDKDRKLLEALSGGKPEETDKDKSDVNVREIGLNPKMLETDLPVLIAKSTAAGAKNVLEYINTKAKAEEIKKKNSESAGKLHLNGGPLIMTREAMSNMKAALNYVKKSGPIKKVDPNKIPNVKPSNLPAAALTEPKSSGIKRKRPEDDNGKPATVRSSSSKEKTPSSSTKPQASTSTSTSSKSLKDKESLKDLNTILKEKDTKKLMQNEEFLKLLHAKSSHAQLAEDLKEEEYFNKLERREAVENKLLSTYSIPTSAVMCKECKYVAVGQSEYCKEKRHQIKIVQAHKRFFKCKDCGQRTMSLDRLPKRTCTNCKSSSWIPTSVGKERTGPKLESEMLAVRGDEEKFLRSSSAKLFLNLS